MPSTMHRVARVSGVDPGTTVTSVAQGVSRSQSFTPPAARERTEAGLGLARLAIGDIAGAVAVLGPLGFAVTDDRDPATGRRYAMAVSATDPRAWGVYLVGLSEPLRLCVAVPHPKSDAGCEQLALRLWRAVPGSMLAMAAVHRDAAVGTGGTADHAHTTASVFHHLWTGVLGPRGVPQIQIHGFDDATAPEQVAVSTGAGPVTPAAVRIADEIAATGLTTTRGWDGTVDPDLLARTNVQTVAADANDWVWVHVEHNRTVRDTPTLWQPAVDAVAAANPALLAYDRPSPGGPGHFPRPIGAANTTGTSRYFAREDHRHRGATDVHSHPEATVRFAPVGLADRSTITADASRGDYFRVHLRGDRTLEAPTGGTDGQRVVIEALASGGQRDLTLGGSIALSAGMAATVTIPAGKRWFGEMVHVSGLGWVVILSAAQA
jgi:hypothetical protein